MLNKRLHSRLALLACLMAAFGLASAQAEEKLCEESGDALIRFSPREPQPGQPFTLLAAATDAPLEALALEDAQGRRIPVPSRQRGGPPWSLTATVAQADAQYVRALALRNGTPIACRALDSGVRKPTPETWGLASEALYSAWIEALFDAPPDEDLSDASLEPVLRNRERNFLYNYLGQNEDDRLPLAPDCADLPYTLRAYFAWKLDLPFAYRACGRGTANGPPRCAAGPAVTDFGEESAGPGVFRRVAAKVMDAVHSGSARTGLEDETTDLYPVPLSRETLKPGTVYADPYGHVLVVVKWIPQSAQSPGSLLAVDAQPDNTVARKRFWEGTFLFAHPHNAGPGFKAFRPLVRAAGGGWRALSNDELVDHPGFTPFSTEQDRLSADDFYAAVGKLVNPEGLDPQQAYESTLDALVEQLETRVNSIDNGEAYFRQHPGTEIALPNGAAIFQTVGAWEDY